jgi:hypothetical protein
MTKKIGVCLVLAFAPLLAGGCTSLIAAFSGEAKVNKDIDDLTTIIYPDGTITYASDIDSVARLFANSDATSQRNVTQQQTQWVSSGAYDYEFNQGELKAGIAQGKYKLGRAEYRSTTSVSIGEWGESGVNFGGNQFVHQVLIPKTVNVTKTVTNVDQKLWQQSYTYFLKGYQGCVIRNWKSTDIPPEVPPEPPYHLDPADYTKVISNNTKRMARLEKRLREEFPLGTTLIYGGYMFEVDCGMVAYLDEAGSFVCEWHLSPGGPGEG